MRFLLDKFGVQFQVRQCAVYRLEEWSCLNITDVMFQQDQSAFHSWMHLVRDLEMKRLGGVVSAFETGQEVDCALDLCIEDFF